MRGFAAGFAHRCEIKLVPEWRAVLALVAQHRVAVALFGQRPADHRALAFAAVLETQLATALADHFRGVVAGDVFECVVDEGHRRARLARVGNHHAVAGGLDGAFKQPQLRLDAAALGDVLQVRQHRVDAVVGQWMKQALDLQLPAIAVLDVPGLCGGGKQLAALQVGQEAGALLRGQHGVDVLPEQVQGRPAVLHVRGGVRVEDGVGVAVEHQQRHRALLEQQPVLRLAVAQRLHEMHAVDGVADAAVQPLGIDRSLHQVVAGAGLHRGHVHRVVAAPGQHDEGARQAFAAYRFDQVQPAGRPQQVVHQVDVVRALAQFLQPLLRRGAPVECVVAAGGIVEQVADEDEIVLVVIDHENPQRRRIHSSLPCFSVGSCTMSVQ